MRRFGIAICATLLAGTALAAVVSPTQAQPHPAADSTDSTDSGAPLATIAPRAETVMLPTGQRVRLSEAGATPVVSLAPSPGIADGPVQVIQAAGRVYVIPTAVSGFIGRGLDLSLFDAEALASAPAETGTGSARGLRLAAAFGPSYRSLPPGLSRVSATSVAVSDPAAFEAALARSWRASQESGRPPTLLSGLRLSLPGSTTQSGLLSRPPRGKLFTVTVKGIDRNGRRAEGDIGVLQNVDNTAKFIAGQTFWHGTFAFSVPRGHYSVDSFIATSAAGKLSFTLASNPQFYVDRDLTVTLDARKGTRFAVQTQRASSTVHGELNVQREPAAGLPFTDSLTTFDPTPLYATPTPPATIGKLYFYPAMRLGDASGSTDDYLYDVEFPSKNAIPDRLRYTVGDSDLATVQARYASVLPDRAEQESRIGGLPWQTILVGAIGTVTAPLTRTEYVSAVKHLAWHQEVDLDPDEGNGRTLASTAFYRPGQHLTSSWQAQPMGSGLEQEPQAGQPCPFCRTGDTLLVNAFPHVDRQNDFMLADAATTESMTLYQDGTEIGSSRGGFASFPLSPDPATYQLVYDTDTSAAWWPTSTHVSTTWSFDSQERAPDQLPPGWTCGGKLASGRASADQAAADGCSFEDALLPRYRASAGLDGVIPAGSTAKILFTGAPQRGHAADPLATVDAQVSFDGGSTWTDAKAVRRSATSYRITFPQPELDQTDGFATLRVSAVAASGASVEQTITHAYPLAPLAALRRAPGTSDGSSRARQPACAAPAKPPLTRCQIVVATPQGDPPAGYGPADLAAAYRLGATGSDDTVAIVTPYDDPNLAADLAAYRTQFGLPNCRVGSGCLAVVNQSGDPSPLPPGSPDWGLQTAQSLDAVSAVCPTCRLLVVEADSSSLDDLATAALTADRLGADVIDQGSGTVGEFSGEQVFERSYRKLHLPFVVAAGDYGYGNGTPLVGSVSYPSASRYAVAVGGTTLSRNGDSRGFTEKAWASTTSGCSAYILKPSWQHDPLCGKRTTADVSADADPATAIAVYDTYGYAGWLTVGGTSLAAAIVSGVYGLNGQPSQGRAAKSLYQPGASLFDIRAGSNGRCQHSYLCIAKKGYDGPSGVGTPNGVSAF